MRTDSTTRPAASAAGGEPSDEALVARAGHGDQRAFEALVRRYQDRIFHFTVRLSGNPTDAEDLTQETFFKAYRAIGDFRGDAKFSTWLFQIAKNLAINGFHRRKRRHEDRHVSIHEDAGDGDDAAWAPQLASPVPDPHEELLASETQHRLSQAIAALDPHYRAALVLRDVEGLDYAEIAQILAVPVGTVKSRIHRARSEVQTVMAPYVEADL